MYLKDLMKQEKACFLAIAKYIFCKSHLDAGYQYHLLGEYEEEMGYPRGFSTELEIPSLKTILGALEESDRVGRRKLFMEILGILMLDEQLFELPQNELDLIATYMDVKSGEYEYFWRILTELKQTYQKMDNLLQQ